MTTSETAARKKELTENFTIEELADMYLKSEQQRVSEHEAAGAEAKELLAQLDAEKQKYEIILEEKDCCVQSNRRLNEHNEALASCLVKATRKIASLENALDVLIEKYARSKGLVKEHED